MDYNGMEKYILCSLSFYCLFLNVHCGKPVDELVILHNPKELNFRGKADLNLSNLKNVFSTALGYSVEAEDTWNGLEVKKPFGFAKALFVFQFPDMSSISSGTDGTYPVVHDEGVEETWTALSERTEQRYPDTSLELKKIVIGDNVAKVYESQESPYVMDVPSDGPIESMNSSRPNSDNDNLFIKELNKLHAVIDNTLSKTKKNGVPDIYWISIPNMSKIVNVRDSDSKDILLNALTMLSDKIKKVYSGKVLIAVLTNSEDSKFRSKRETTPVQSKSTLESLNVAEDYDQDFPVIFNIVFWFSLAMLFAVIAICMVIGGMDPGRDSIIYRMTSTRMKKDN